MFPTRLVQNLLPFRPSSPLVPHLASKINFLNSSRAIFTAVSILDSQITKHLYFITGYETLGVMSLGH
jgi:hypothetical protein